MTEETKLILEEMAKMRSEMTAMHSDMATMHSEIQTLRKEMHEGFADTYAAIHTCHDTLNARIDTVEHNLTQKITDLQLITGQNCFELTLLKAKQA